MVGYKMTAISLSEVTKQASVRLKFQQTVYCSAKTLSLYIDENIKHCKRKSIKNKNTTM